MSKNRYLKLTTGSTLIEVLVAILIVGLVVTGVMLSITYSVKNSAEARYREVASQLAQDGMEVVKLRREIDPWVTFYGLAPRRACLGASATILTTIADSTNSNCTVTNGNKTFTRFVELSGTASSPGVPATVTAKVTVQWNSDSNAQMDVVISQQFRERVI